MKRALLFMPVVIMLLYGMASGGEKIGPRPENQPVFIGNEPLPDLPYYPSQPGMTTDSPGIIVGGTQYDYQSNGSTGRRIAFDDQGGVHIDWMNGVSYPSVRHIYYNYKDNAGTWLAPGIGTSISQQTGAGYSQLEITNDDRAVAAYHQWQTSPYTVAAIDAFSGFGIFNYYDPPDFVEGVRCYWPYVAVDRNDRIHLVVNEQAINGGDPHLLAYTMSTDNGDTWNTITVVDTLMALSPVVVASPVSDKVAIAYTHPQNFDTQWENDIYYIESDDGLIWDWRFGKVNVTNYGPPDSLFAYIDMDAIYDYNDNLNLIWNAQWVTDEGIYFHTFLYHYNQGSNQINLVTETDPSVDTLWSTGNCQVSSTPSKPFGAWNRAITKMSLGVHHDVNSDMIVALWTQFDPGDCSASGWGNGDLYFSYSTDFANWNEPANLTNSNTDGCVPGDCDSDHWASLADNVDGSLHITYINDKDAGGIAQTEGSVTDNPVMYLEAYPLGVDSGEKIPRDFELSQNYPNPFNAETVIRYELQKPSEVDLSIYDITGAKVSTLVRGSQEAGRHSAGFDASKYSSGIYYYRLRVEGSNITRKMTLIK